MNVTILLSSGDEDAWENASVEIDTGLGGTLLVREEAGELASDEGGAIVAMYAPGMWMKVEFDRG